MTENYTPDELSDNNNLHFQQDPTISTELLHTIIDEQIVQGNLITETEQIVNNSEKKKAESKIKVATREIEKLKKWLIKDRSYTEEYIDEIIQGLKPGYDSETNEAVVIGDINLSMEDAWGLKLPVRLMGSLDLRNLKSSEGVVLPKYVGGNLNLSKLPNAEDLDLPKYVGGNLHLDLLNDATGLDLSDYIGGNLRLLSILSTDGIIFPKHVGEGVIFRYLSQNEIMELNEDRPDLYFENEI
jgi:hypothetical protein